MQTASFVTSIRENLGTTRTEAKVQALTWLASQLRWERTLDLLRGGNAPVAEAA
jgi:hypothetical protein